MAFGPIIDRELLTMARKPRGHGLRVGIALLMFGALAANYFGWREYYENQGVFTLAQLSSYARSTFISLAILQLILTLVIVPSLVSPAIAEEKERKTLHYMLATRLGNGEIILGKLGARMLQYLTAISAGVPILLSLTLMGGFRPEEVFLLFGLTLSLAYFLGGVNIFASTMSRRTKSAGNAARGWSALWFMSPILYWLLSMWGIIPRILRPSMDVIHDWVIAASPLTFFSNTGLFRGTLSWASMEEQYYRMVGLHVAYGTLFILLSIWQLRPAFRRQDGPPKSLWDWLRRRHAKPRKHPAIGERPIFWKECFTSLPAGPSRYFGILSAIFFIGLLLLLIVTIAGPIFVEMWSNSRQNSGWIITRRNEFNLFVRSMTAVFYGFGALIIAGSAATSITGERERDTWEGLLTTTLTPREILGGKLVGSIYQQRWLLIPIGMILLSGLFSGSLSPVGLLIGLIEMTVFVVFAAVVGMWSSLFASGTSQASSWAGGILMLANLILVLVGWAFRISSVYFYTLCSPAILLFSLFPAVGSETVRFVGEATPGATIFVCLAGTLFYAVFAAVIAHDALRRFDRAVGRPRRLTQTRSESITVLVAGTQGA
jgi:ABC-type Na+ efflux pump permease subunit